MPPFPIPQPIAGQLANEREPVLICDYTGRVLGQFIPTANEQRVDLGEPPLSREELDRRFARTGGRTLSEILADLEKRA